MLLQKNHLPKSYRQAKKIMIEEATEKPYSSPLNQESREGFFHCANCGAKLFASNVKI
jgi:peptide-methionine (R)-S-oxide reductase